MSPIMLNRMLSISSAFRAITEGMKVAHGALQRKAPESPYMISVDQISDSVICVNPATLRIEYCNLAFTRTLGFSLEEARNLTLTDVFVDESVPREVLKARLVQANVNSGVTNASQRHKNGSLLDSEIRCSSIDLGMRELLLYVARDISVRIKVEQQLLLNQQRLDRMAHHDQLTGLPNRHFLSEFLPRAIAEAKSANAMVGVIFLDLDHFKHINDTRGHETGDQLLQEVARRLRACVREADVVIRMGGDEFVVVMPRAIANDDVSASAARIVDSLKKPISIGGHDLQTTGSVGVSLFPRDGADIGELLKHSDTAMYQAKERGRNNVQMFNPVMNQKLKHRVAMEDAIREAMRSKQLDVHYQPLMHFRDRKVIGLEALLRWRHPTHGMIQPDKFIPVAEESGLIVPLGNFVLQRALADMNTWRRAGATLVPMSVNVSPGQLRRGQLHTIIAALLKSSGVSAEMLQLEMTERVMFDGGQNRHGESSKDSMSRLRDLGVRLAIDDFGTGYSSLSYLKTWHVDALKIDRSFIRDIVTDTSDLAIVNAIVAMARHLNIEVIAEGIESYQQVEALLKLGCNMGQGFLFAKPMPAAECLPWLTPRAPLHAQADAEEMLILTA